MATNGTTDYDSYVHEPNCTELDHIPGDDGAPLVGHTIRFLKDPFVWAREQSQKCGYLTRLNMHSRKGVVALGPDLVQQVLLDPGRDFSNKMGFMDRVARFFEGSLIMEDFEHHRHQRRIMQTAFKNTALQYYTREINRIYARAERVGSRYRENHFILPTHQEPVAGSRGLDFYW